MSKSYIKELYRQRTESGKPRACLIVVPGIGTTSPDGWNQSRQQPWLDALVQRLGAETVVCTVVAVYHGLVVEKLRSWNELRIKGNEVLECIEFYLFKEKMVGEPLVLVGHSLGGVLIKQALVQAWQTDHNQFFDDLHGVVFLSTPHLSSDVTLHWRRPLGILLTQVKKVNKDLTGEAELRSLAQVSELFEDLTLPVSILSIWETKPTKLKGTLEYANGERVSKCVLVDKALARTSAGLEVLTSVDSDHGNSCVLVERSLSRQTLIDFVQDCFQEHLNDKSGLGDRPGVRRLSLPPLTMTTDLNEASSFGAIDEIASGTERSAISLPDIILPPQRRPDPHLNYHLMEAGTLLDDFFPRLDVFKKLDQALHKGDQTDDTTSLVVMYGIGGVGKTSAVATYLNDRRSEYDATFWITADDPDKIRDAFTTIAVEMRLLDVSETRDRFVTQKTVLDWLEEPVKTYDKGKQRSLGYTRWLMVFDNVDDDRVLNEFAPKRGGGAIVVTSRDPDIGVFARNGRLYKELPMKPLKIDDAVNFLRRLTPTADNPDENSASKELAERLDGMPLALRQMGNYIQRRRGMSIRKFLHIYEEEGDHKPLHATWDQRQSTKYEHNMSTVFALDKLSKPSRSLLDVLSLIDPDHIQEDLLVYADLSCGNSYPCSAFEYVEARTELWRASLITYDPEKDELSMHRTVQDACRATMSEAEYQMALEIVSELILRQWPVKERLWHYPVDHWSQCQMLCLHVNKLTFHVTHNRRMKGHRTVIFAKLLAYAGWYFHERGDSYQAKSYFDTAELICTHLSEEDLLADLWLYQGCVATETNDGDSVVKYYTMLLNRTQRLTPDPTTTKEFDDVAIAMNEMGIGYMMKQQIVKARGLFETARDSVRNLRKTSPTSVATYMFATANLGLAFWLSDQWKSALEVLESGYEEYEATIRPGEKKAFMQVTFAARFRLHADVNSPGRLMHAIGNVYTSRGLEQSPPDVEDLKAGFAWHQKAYKHYISTIGPDHHRTADVAYRLADDYMIAADHIGADRGESCHYAEIFVDRALKVFSSKKCYVPERMRALHLKAVVFETAGRKDSAIELFGEVKTLYDRFESVVLPGSSRARDGPARAELEQLVTFWSR